MKLLAFASFAIPSVATAFHVGVHPSRIIANDNSNNIDAALLQHQMIVSSRTTSCCLWSTESSDDTKVEEVDMLLEASSIFDSIDVNKDGVISTEELRDHLEGKMGYSIESVRYLFAVFDSDGDGMISKEELLFAFEHYEAVALYMTLGVGGSEFTDGAMKDVVKNLAKAANKDSENRDKFQISDLADLIFDMIDTDHNGEIDAEELEKHFLSHASPLSVESILDTLDLNSDGVISREEMREGFKQHDHRSLAKALGLRVYA